MTLLDFTWRASVLLALALGVVKATPKCSAAVRHWIIAAAVAGVLALPMLAIVAPSWSAPAMTDDSPSTRSAASAEAVATPVADAAVDGAEATTVSQPESRSMRGLLTTVWSLGSAASGLALALALLRLFVVVRRSRPVTDALWTATALEVATRYGITRPVAILESPRPSLLVACGWRRPMVLVPPAARHWTPQRVQIVLAHELAHLARGDWAWQLAAETLRAVLWFNPLAWFASRRLRDESERACDDLVLATNVDPADYAAELLALARTLQPSSRSWNPAPAMAHPSSLERRVAAMLEPHLTRRSLSFSARAAGLVAATLVATAVAGYGVAAQSFSSVAGRVVDTLGGHIGGVTVTLTHMTNGQKYQVVTSSVGTFEVVGVLAGDYDLDVRRPGFRTMQERLTVGTRAVRRDVTLPVGSLEESITVGAPPPPPPPPPAPPSAEIARQRLANPAVTPAACVPSASGGVIKPPTKTVDVRPRMPAGIAGQAVRMTFDATIGPDGSIIEVKPVDPSSNVELVAAATDAIRQWQYTPTLLNCTPIAVTMQVTVVFRN